MSQIFTRIEGQGKPLVVLHGWGMNHQAWQPVRTALAEKAQVSWIDLPGHGRSHPLPLGGMDLLVEQLTPHIPKGAVIMGWSMGGLVAQALAHGLGPGVAGLVLVASTPRFVAGDGWPHGLPTEVLAGFADNLKQDYAATVKRFLALQFMGVRTDPKAVHALRDGMMGYPATVQALEAGLEILRHTDFSQCPVQQPSLWLLGKLDKLIPASLADGLAELGYPRVEVLPKAAHMPFVTHPENFMQAVGTFIDEC